MIKMIKKLAEKNMVIIGVLLLVNSFLQGQSKSLLSRTETKILHSNIIDQDFEIYISFPVNYFQNDISFYPVLYCTDGNRNFNMVSNIINVLSFPGNEIPKILVVGIGYKIKGLEDWVHGGIVIYFQQMIPKKIKSGKIS
jgi:hypothetical protein